MARVEKDDLIARISAKIGDDEESLTILEDLSDTMEPVDVSGYEKQIAELTAKNQEIEDTWRAKYKARFTQAPAPEQKNETPDNVDTPSDNSEEEESIEELANRIQL